MNWTEAYFRAQMIGKIVDFAIAAPFVGIIIYMIVRLLIEIWKEHK